MLDREAEYILALFFELEESIIRVILISNHAILGGTICFTTPLKDIAQLGIDFLLHTAEIYAR